MSKQPNILETQLPLQIGSGRYDPSDSSKPWTYLREGEPAKGHTPIYKLHKYFARRPQNVFRRLISHYTRPGDLVFDPFCGGGVTVFEGIAEQRRVFAQDINPLAVFITRCQAQLPDLWEYNEAMLNIRRDFDSFASPFYRTRCRATGEHVAARWYEHAFNVICGACGEPTTVSNRHKANDASGPVNGVYLCQCCGARITAVDAAKTNTRLLSVTYDSPASGRRETHPIDECDEEILKHFITARPKLIRTLNLWFPEETIPESWDRSQEDCLHRKGITRFTDLFTERNLVASAYILQQVRAHKGKVSDSTYNLLLLTFSATLTYTNIMTISAEQWMDGRPVAWSKHAFWVPYQFVETNPAEFLRKRHKGFMQGLQYSKQRLFRSNCVDTFEQLLSEGTHIVRCGGSQKVALPNCSVHAVVTDPPYGSNVQYGELSSFWLVWLKDDLGLKSAINWFADEAVVHRKTKVNRKTHATYYRSLRSVFEECHRVLKPAGPLIFTFNNKDIRTLFCVLKAALDAGFILEPAGIVYQDPIEIYKQTSHQRFRGTLHGDFIYTFKKRPSEIRAVHCDEAATNPSNLSKDIDNICRSVVSEHGSLPRNEIYLKVIAQIIPLFVRACHTDRECETQLNAFELTDLDSIIDKAMADGRSLS